MIVTEFVAPVALKTVLSFESPTLIELRPYCQVCRDRIAQYRVSSGAYAFCRECRPHQAEPEAAELEAVAKYCMDPARYVPASQEYVESCLDLRNAREEAARDAWHYELLNAEAEINELRESIWLLEKEHSALMSLEYFDADAANELHIDMQSCEWQLSQMLNQYGAELELPIY